MAQAFRGRRRRWLVIAIGVVVLLIILLNVLSGFYIDLLWFREVRFSGVFWTIFWSKVLLGVVFGVLFFALLYVNLLIVRRLTPTFRVFSPEQEVIERYRVAVEPYVKWILPGLSALIALFVGIGAASKWQTFLLWKNSSGVSFSTPGLDLRDPVFHRDPSFYVFHLPWLHFLQGWLFSALVGVAVISVIGHYLWGGIRLQTTAERVTPQVKAHLSVLLGLIVLVKAWGYYLGRFDLLTSNGVTGANVTGAGYTDTHAKIPALTLLVFIAIACAIAFLVNIRFRGWALPAIAIGLLALASIVAGAIFPAAIQKFSVAPQQLQRERTFIDRNIQATRTAFQLDGISTSDTSPTQDITHNDVTSSATTVSNIRLWDPNILKSNYDQLQRIKQFYEFQDVDVDRYPINGSERMVMVSAREVSQKGIPGNAGNWQNQHLVYTHGFGFVASQVNTSSSDGTPDFIETDIPPVGTLDIAEPRVYYGERQDVPFVVVNTGVPELDFQTDSQQKAAPRYHRVNGYEGGIKVGGLFSRVLFAWRYKDVNLLISGLIHGDSRMLIFRSLSSRIPKPAPFLKYDGDPYSAVVGGRIVWIQDAYTTTDAYPYSQEVDLGRVTGRGHLSGRANYIRNSVKVVVDAYTGQMHYYVVDPTDPIIQVWEKAFPDLFTPVDQAPTELQAHFRYPEDLFSVEAQQFARYHVTDSSVFFQNQDLWTVPIDPTTTVTGGNGTAMHPYYVLLQLPGEPGESFHLILPFTPAPSTSGQASTIRNNMVAWMAAGSDPANYGKIVSFEFPSGENVFGPIQVFNKINSDPTFSKQRTLLGTGGSEVVFGNFLVIPLGNGFLYVEPVFVKGAGAGSFPQLKLVLVVHGNTVGIGSSLTDALANSFGQAPPPNQGPPAKGTLNQRVRALLAQAVQEFQAADAALRRGDLATYAVDVAKAEALIKQANDLALGKTPTPTPTVTSPTPSPSSS